MYAHPVKLDVRCRKHNASVLFSGSWSKQVWKCQLATHCCVCCAGLSVLLYLIVVTIRRSHVPALTGHQSFIIQPTFQLATE